MYEHDVVAIDIWRAGVARPGAELLAAARPDAACTNVTHTRGCSLLVAAPVRVGVDAEVVRRRVLADRVAARAMLDDELAAWHAIADHARDRALLQHWTRVEAYLKAIGEGVRGGLRTRPPAGWAVVDLPLGAAHVGAVAIEHTGPLTLRWHPIKFSPRGGTSG
jgi:4'-phosphopantetheinyl transferase